MSDTPSPLLSAVVVNYNGSRWLPGLLDSVQPQLAALSSEIILVDNASTDDSVALVCERYPNVIIVQGAANRGYAAGANLGLSRARGDWILVLNTDLFFPQGSVKALLAEAQRRPRLGLAGPLLIDGSGAVTSSYGYEPDERTMFIRLVRGRHLEVIPDRVGPPVQDVPYLVGACLLVRRAALTEVGPMDERFFMYFEDVDWSRRFRQAGWEVALLREVQVAHFGGGTSSHALAQPVRWFYLSLGYFARKHYGPARALLIRMLAIATHVLGLSGRWALACLHRTGRGETYRQGQALHRAALRALLVEAGRQNRRQRT